jgi:membrane protein implicated in regulation of membrane protease activity
MQLYEIIFGVPVLVGVMLVLGAAAGALGLEADFDADLDADGEADADGFLAALGVGRVPTVLIAMLLLLLFGGVGLAVYPLCAAVLSSKAALLSSWLLAGLFSLLVTRLSSRTLARWIPSVETYASTKRELVGQAATVIARLPGNELVLRVLDRGGAELRVRGFVRGAAPRIGETLVVTYYEPTRDAYWVDRLALTD